MPYQEPDATDPMEMVAHSCPAEPGDVERMAELIVDEYVRFGFDQEKLLKMFREPFFAMTHNVWREKGDDWCVALVERVCSEWRRS